jgi:hypothetical protein
MDIGGGVVVRGVSSDFFFTERFCFLSVGTKEEGTSEGVGSAALAVSMVRLVSIFQAFPQTSTSTFCNHGRVTSSL